MRCLLCAREDFLTEEEVMTHMLQEHGAQSLAKEMERAQKLVTLYGVASGLTNASIGDKGATKEETLERFRFFVKELYGIFRETGK